MIGRLLCMISGHTRSKRTVRSFQGHAVAECKRCGKEMIRDPNTGWRLSGPKDNRGRRIYMSDAEEAEPENKPTSRRSLR